MSIHPTVMIRETAVIEDSVEIGAHTRIWHFTHVLTGASVGANCVIGQNVMIDRNVKIGRGCKIQNNVSIYTGVTLEDDVFCGPSCVFTNVVTPSRDRPPPLTPDEFPLKRQLVSLESLTTAPPPPNFENARLFKNVQPTSRP